MTAENNEQFFENGEEESSASEVLFENEKSNESETQMDITNIKHESKELEKNEQSPCQRALLLLYKDPSFAIICSFFNRFGSLLGLKPQSFSRIEQLLTSFHETGRVDRDLIDLHLTLLRKLNFKSARAPVWEKFLLKFCSLTSTLESEFLQLERFGYLNTPPATKLAVLKALCEAQFDFNLKFRETVSSVRGAANLRLLPVGSDCHGLAYWYQQDSCFNIRVYTEEPDDHSGNSWSLVAKSKEDLESLLEELRALCSETDSSSSSRNEASKSSDNETTERDSYDFEVNSKRGDILDLFKQELSLAKVNNKEGKVLKTKKKDPIVEKAEKEALEKVEDLEAIAEESTDRRVLPRRSAKNIAINHLKELTSPLKKMTNISKEGSKKRGRPPRITKPAKEEDYLVPQENTTSGCDGEEIDDGGEDFALSEDEDDSDDPSSDDDFMPLSEIKKRGKRQRRCKGKKTRNDLYNMEEDEQDEDDDSEEEIKKERKQATVETLCKNCKKSNNPEVLLLCDMCDDAWHTWCLHPMLWFVPDGDWFCPKCHHLMLIEKFVSILATLSSQLKHKIAEDKRKEAAAERLKREMDFIGVSVNNIIPQIVKPNKKDFSDLSDYSTDADDGERKSKKRANRRLGMYPERAVVPIALGRSRRHVAKVDYNFGAYDQLIKEAMESIDSTATKPKWSKDPVRPQGGAGRGKDMSNILNAEQKRQSSVDTSAGEERLRKSRVGKAPKCHHRLNDLDVDEMTESESDEYKASEDASEASDVISDDFDEYVPSDEVPRRRSSRRRRSDDDFVVSGSESDYSPTGRKSRKTKRMKRSRKRKGGHSRRILSGEDSTSEESYDYQSDYSLVEKKKRKFVIGSKWAPRASSSDEGSDYNLKTSSGRPLRQAVYKSKTIQRDESEEEDDDVEQEAKDHKKRFISQWSRKKQNSDEEAFSLDEEEEEEDDEDEGGVEDEEDGNDDEEDEKEVYQKNVEDQSGSSEKNGDKVEFEKVKEDKSSADKALDNKYSSEVINCYTKTSVSSGDMAVKPGLTKKNISESGFVSFKRGVDAEIPSTSIAVEPSSSQLQYSVAPKVTGSVETPSVVMQQMAQLAAATPMSHYIPIVSPPQGIPATPSFSNTLSGFLPEKIPYTGPPPTTYTVHPISFTRIPTAVPPSVRHAVPPEGWQQCSIPHNVFTAPPLRVSSAPIPPRHPIASSQNPSDTESLSNALASAMEY